MVSDNKQIKKNPFHILALSGGGYKGLYTAKIIAHIEEHTGKPFASHFDLVSGTSVGGIIALALATREISAQEMLTTLLNSGPDIFKPVERPKLKLGWLKTIKSYVDKKIYQQSGFTFDRGIVSAKHSNEVLKATLHDIFGNRKIEDLKTRIIIPTANWTKGGPQFFKTPHNKKFTQDKKRSLVDIAMATSAAPIYLPNYEFENQVYVDGGIVGNAPGIFGVHEAEQFIPESKNKTHKLLSIGAISSRVTANQGDTLNKGMLQWKENIFNLMLACQEQTSDFMMQHKLGENYHMIDATISTEQDKVVALDKANEASTETLLGLATMTFQDEIAKQPLNDYIFHQVPGMDFKKIVMS